MNNTPLFNLNKFRKIKNNSYNNKENCLKNSKKWGKNYITNPKFPLFDHKFFTCGDVDDFNQYGILNAMYYLSKDYSNNIKEKTNEKINQKISKKQKKEEIKQVFDFKDYFKLYKNIDIESIINTFTYIFYKIKKGVFIIIHNNELVLYLPFSNHDYINNWFDKIYFSLEEKKLLEENDYHHIQDKLRKNIMQFMNEHPEQYANKKIKINFNRKKWHANNCVFRNQFPEYEGDLNIDVFKNMFVELCKNRKIPNAMFFLNYRDAPILTKKLTEPYFHLFDSKSVSIEQKFKFKKFCPILSQSITSMNADLLIPTSDDWRIHSSKYFTGSKCSNAYHPSSFNKMELDWKKKKNICVFRGSATGCGMTLENNMRLKAAQLSLEHPKLLDAGITDWKPRDKKFIGEPIKIINPKDFNFNLVEGISMDMQSKYKYILHIDGYVSAFRLSSEMRMNSVLLICKSDYNLWYSHLMVEYEHFVPVKNDLSDLIDQIKWCLKNDKKCMQIASNAMEFYKKYLTIDGVFDYMQQLIMKIHLNMNIKNPLVLKKSKKNVAIIVCFRDSGNNVRNQQKIVFVKSLTSIFKELFNFHIFIIEQSPEGGFNIGKLKNIGFVEANKVGVFDYYILSDVDMIPNYELLHYYQKKPKYPMCLAASGTRYRHQFIKNKLKKNLDVNKNKNKGKKPFTGGVMSFTKKDFEKINGYPNNFRNWGGEDDSLLIRMSESKMNNLIYPKNGSVIDIEKNNSGKPKNVLYKTTEIEKNKTMEYQKYEKLLIDIQKWKKNGINSLLYKNLGVEKLNDVCTQITVDLMYKEEEKKYPEFYPAYEEMNNTTYKRFRKECKDKLNYYYGKINIVYL